jgi:hypothetical protein
MLCCAATAWPKRAGYKPTCKPRWLCRADVRRMVPGSAGFGARARTTGTGRRCARLSPHVPSRYRRRWGAGSAAAGSLRARLRAVRHVRRPCVGGSVVVVAPGVARSAIHRGRAARRLPSARAAGSPGIRGPTPWASSADLSLPWRTDAGSPYQRSLPLHCFKFSAALIGASLLSAKPVFAHGFAGPHSRGDCSRLRSFCRWVWRGGDDVGLDEMG